MSEVMDGGQDAGLRILLQLALDEMLNVVEAVNDRHDKNSNHLKYTTPYGAINGMVKVREDILAQAAMWGVELSPHRPPANSVATARLVASDEGVEMVARAIDPEAWREFDEEVHEIEHELEAANMQPDNNAVLALALDNVKGRSGRREASLEAARRVLSAIQAAAMSTGGGDGR